MNSDNMRRLFAPPSPFSHVRFLIEPVLDLSTPENRARDRHRRAALTVIMSMIAKFVSVGAALISVPLTLHYLGTERFGMWMVLSSLIAMLSFADLGVGNGILNLVAAANGRDDAATIRRVVSSGLAALTLVAAAICLGFALVYPHVAWEGLFNVHSPVARAEAGPAILVFVLCFALAIPAGVVLRVQMGLQQGFTASLWQCGGSLLTLAAIVAAIQLRLGLPWLIVAALGGPLLANVLNSVVFFGRGRPDIRPTPAAASFATGMQAVRTGMLFLLLQVAAGVTYSSSTLLIAQLLGAEHVAQYTVPERLFSLVSMVATMALQPLWPAYREAIVRGDSEWTRRTLFRSLQISLGLSTVMVVPLVILAPWILRLWVGQAVDPPTALILGLGVWKVFEAISIALAMFLNGAHAIRVQVVVASASAVVAVALQILLIRSFGVAGVPWGVASAILACALLPYAMLLPRLLARLDKR